MEEQDHTCGSTWEPSKDKSHLDSPWSWVRAVRDRPWPSSTEGTRGILCAERVPVRIRVFTFYQISGGTSCSPGAPVMEAEFIEVKN